MARPRSPRGRSERALGTIQGRLPQELRLDGIRRFTVTPADPESASTPLAGIDLELQLPRSKGRIHFARCPVIVHQSLNGSFAISNQGRLVARFGKDGQPLRKGGHDSKAA